jgi:hypothetical protein
MPPPAALLNINRFGVYGAKIFSSWAIGTEPESRRTTWSGRGALMRDETDRHAVASSWRWTWAGGALGALHGALAAPHPWQGEAVFFDIGSAGTNALVVALLARGAGWLWPRRGAGRDRA